MHYNRTTSFSLILFIIFIFIVPGVVLAQDDNLAVKKINSPEFIDGTTRVDAEGLIDLAETIPDIIIIDSRITGDREQGYIEGSKSLPDINTTCDTLKNIIPEKSLEVLFYCNGVKCGRSAKALKIALDCGYTHLYWFRGGFEEWLNKGYPYLTL